MWDGEVFPRHSSEHFEEQLYGRPLGRGPRQLKHNFSPFGPRGRACEWTPRVRRLVLTFTRDGSFPDLESGFPLASRSFH